MVVLHRSAKVSANFNYSDWSKISIENTKIHVDLKFKLN